MALDRLALEFAVEINNHDWSDTPYRADRAGHRRSTDRRQRGPTREQANKVRANAMLVVAQVLGHKDPDFDLHKFAEACGVEGFSAEQVRAGRRISLAGRYATPGAWDPMWAPGEGLSSPTKTWTGSGHQGPSHPMGRAGCRAVRPSVRHDQSRWTFPSLRSCV
ncbi:hypothetical protein OG780_06450 [Streptomyces sp. NBC_00386]|jgi:hypothetical protein|uniref:hypothetical protein n=1 Tax=Streptomyces sp. NBC_00386 TaxID=2975734 RepID=UPI002E1BB9B4